MSQFHFDPDSYLENIRADIERFSEFQEAIAAATRNVEASKILELGTGTGETTRRVLEHHPRAELVGIDESESMLEHARKVLPESVTLRVRRLQKPLPEGPFGLVFSALTIHHLDSREKAVLFRRIASVLLPGGSFVLGDVVVPEREEDAVIPLSEGFDRPDPLDDQLEWLVDAGFDPRVTWAWKDLAVVSARF